MELETNKIEGARKKVQLLSFGLGKEEYGAEIGCILSIDRLSHLTKIPGTPEFIAGLTNRKGKIIPVVNLNRRLGLPAVSPGKETRLLTINIGNLISGFIVDSVKEIINVPVSSLQKPPGITNSGTEGFVKCVGKIDGRMIMILNFAKILSHPFMGEQS
jgi:purine-binding chemotaxis protein CheW